MQEDSMSADRATTAQLESVNGRLKKGEGWVGYRFSNNAERDYPSNMSKLAHLDKFFGKMKVTSITTDVLRSYITHRRKHVANPTIRRELNILRAMFNLALKAKKISHDSMPWFPMPDDSLPAGQYITPAQF